MPQGLFPAPMSAAAISAVLLAGVSLNSVLFKDSAGLVAGNARFQYDGTRVSANPNAANIADSLTLGAAAGTTVMGTYNTVLGCAAGDDLLSSAQRNVLIGYSAGNGLTSGSDNIFIGDQASPFAGTVDRSISLGRASATNISDSIAIGYQAGRPGGSLASGGGILIGANANPGAAANVIGLGNSVNANGTSSIAIGNSSTSSSNFTLVLGHGSTASGNGSMAFGEGITSSAAGTIGFGNVTAARYITDVWFGGLTADPAPQALTLRGSNASGTNIAGQSLILYGGRATGSASGGGTEIRGYAAGSSGSALNSSFFIHRTTSAGVEFITASNAGVTAFFQHTGFNGIAIAGTSEGYTFESRSVIGSTAVEDRTLGVLYASGTSVQNHVEWGRGLNRTARLCRTVGGWAAAAIAAIGRDNGETSTSQTLFRVGNRNPTATLNLTGSALYFQVADYDTTTNTETSIFTVDAARNVMVRNNLGVGRDLNVGDNAGAADAIINIGANRSADGNSYIDLYTANGTYPDYALRMVRYSGANGGTDFLHRGTGIMTMFVQDGGSFRVMTNSAERFSVKPDGQANFFGLAADPAGAANGDVYYNSTTNKLRVYAAGAWADLH